jgi:hypothetical protein
MGSKTVLMAASALLVSFACGCAAETGDSDPAAAAEPQAKTEQAQVITNPPGYNPYNPVLNPPGMSGVGVNPAGYNPPGYNPINPAINPPGYNPPGMGGAGVYNPPGYNPPGYNPYNPAVNPPGYNPPGRY